MAEWTTSNPTEINEQKGFMRRWSSRLWRAIRNFFALIGFVYTVVPLALIWFMTSQMQPHKPSKVASTASKDQKKTLWLNLDSVILEREPDMGQALFNQLFGKHEGLYLPDIGTALKRAASDESILALNLKIDGLGASLSSLDELAQQLAEFRDTSKKPVHAYVSHMDNAALMISSTCDKVYLAPVAEVMIPGPVFGQIYFGEALRKLGVDVQVVRAGKYKSAFEALIANEQSPESKEMMEALETSLRSHLVQHIAKGRQKQPSEPHLWLKESIFTAAKAKELGIVDELAYAPSIDFESPDHQALLDYSDENASALPKGYSLGSEKGIALIEATGEITSMGEDHETITPEAVGAELDWARTNNEIAAVVLRVSSPGGSASASDEIWDQVRRLNDVKPVIASFGSVAASGGYYISVAAKKIIANPSTITGSIGVIGLIPNFEPFKEKYGVTFPITTQSNRAAMLSGGRKMSVEDHKYLGDSIDDTYSTFKARVAEGRKLSLEKVESMAQGRVYSGQQAKELGLIDELGSLKDAFQLAKREAGLDETRLYPVHRYEPAEFSLSECFSSMNKMRRCLKKHGGSLSHAIKKEVIGSQLLDLQQQSLLWQHRGVSYKERVLTQYEGGAAF
jgi:protease-4